MHVADDEVLGSTSLVDDPARLVAEVFSAAEASEVEMEAAYAPPMT